jgi:hypothetical protein
VSPTQRTAQKLRELKISPVTAVTDFLSAIRRTTVASIEKVYPAEYVGVTNIEYVLTIPANWSDSAKNLMVRAVEGAGFGTHRIDFNLIGEPEAIAVYILNALQPNALNVS